MSTRRAVLPAVLLCTVLIGALCAGPAQADEMGIKPAPIPVTFAKHQANLANCVVGVSNVAFPGAAKKKPITEAKVTFERANSCRGVDFTLTVVDEDGNVSAGEIVDLPFHPENKPKDRVVEVDLPSGKAMKDAKPISYSIVY